MYVFLSFRDGSDEPGTSACPSGQFYCVNKGYKPTKILSSRVNDGICDCCDGSDEWDSNANCQNKCIELGIKAAEELKQQKELHEKGYQKKLEYSTQGKERTERSRTELTEKVAELETLKTEVDRLREIKDAAEEPEREAKDAHRKKWEEEKEARKEEKRRADAKFGFDEIDTNSDGYVNVEEIRARTELDDDRDGEVSESEALEYLDDAQYVDFETFLSSIWDVISDKCHFQRPTHEPLLVTPIPEAGETDHNEGEDPDGFDDDDDDDDYSDDEEEFPNSEEEKMPEYDPETQALIEVADEARAAFREQDNKKSTLDREIADLNKYLGIDFGPDYEFSPLYDNCYEYTDREYTYKMCGYSKVTQRPKNGGRETNLGTWGSWNGPSDNVFSSMKYDNGEKCWNGPSRSATISIKCGTEDELLSASEPNRCEYAMDFSTPAACTHSLPNRDIHEEL